MGEAAKVQAGDDTVYLNNPGEFKLQMTQQGPAPIIIPLGMFLENGFVKYIERAPCEYIYAGVADKQLVEIYEDFIKKLVEAETGLIMPKAEDVSAINSASKGKGNIIQFSSK